MLGAEGHQMAGRLGAGVLKELGSQIIFADVMIDDNFGPLKFAHDLCHRAELSPSAGI